MSEDVNTLMTGEITGLAQRINRYAVRRGWSKSRLCKEFPALGSDRTFRDLLAGRADAYDQEAQLISLRGVWTELEEVSGEGYEEVIYDDLTAVATVGGACLTAMKNWGINRVVIVLGEPGAGKTKSIKHLAGRYPDRVLICEASDVWADKPSALLAAMLEQLGEMTPPISAVAMLRLLQRKLSVTRRCMVVDEAHHLGPKCLNTVKTLVNQTPGEFVLLAIPSLWAKLRKAAYIEALQLTTNRLCELVEIKLDEPDIARYLRHRIPQFDLKMARMAAKLIRPPAMSEGNMSFVRDVADELVAESELSIKIISEAVTMTLAKRTESRKR